MGEARGDHAGLPRCRTPKSPQNKGHPQVVLQNCPLEIADQSHMP